MSEQVGKIEKPLAEDYVLGRKLYFIPLILTPKEAPADFQEIVNKYWDQIQEHVTNLEMKLGEVKKVFHELVPVGGTEGTNAIEGLNTGSFQITKSRLDKGAELQPIEDGDLLTELMDWSRCLATGLQNQKIFTKVYEFYMEAWKKRNEHIGKRIDETLQDGEAGILFIGEGHSVQFPSDVQVLYVAPPGLDEIKRWMRAHEAAVQNKTATEPQESQESTD